MLENMTTTHLKWSQTGGIDCSRVNASKKLVHFGQSCRRVTGAADVVTASNMEAKVSYVICTESVHGDSMYSGPELIPNAMTHNLPRCRTNVDCVPHMLISKSWACGLNKRVRRDE